MAQVNSIKVEDFKCPNCGKYCDLMHNVTGSFISKTEAEFCYESDPHYRWEEKHKCTSCETLFTVTNGT